MSDEKIQLEDSELISSRKAAAIFGFSNDHISRLCRQGKIVGVLDKGLWLVEKKSLYAYFEGKRPPRRLSQVTHAPRPISSYEQFSLRPESKASSPAGRQKTERYSNTKLASLNKLIAAAAFVIILTIGSLTFSHIPLSSDTSNAAAVLGSFSRMIARSI